MGVLDQQRNNTIQFSHDFSCIETREGEVESLVNIHRSNSSRTIVSHYGFTGGENPY